MKYEIYTGIDQPEAFWAAQADEIDGIVNRKRFFIQRKWISTWYKDGELNICYLTLDKHIQDGYGDQVAFI
jgi:propionyl-CoA synthetase